MLALEWRIFDVHLFQNKCPAALHSILLEPQKVCKTVVHCGVKVDKYPWRRQNKNSD
jgi:hypothetical protein